MGAGLGNINWPRKPGLSVEEQKSRTIALLDLLDKNNQNAVVFRVGHIVMQCIKATSSIGHTTLPVNRVKPSDPLYDPLQFWIDRAHARVSSSM